MNVTETILKLYPKAKACMNNGSHIGDIVATWELEPEFDDDRYHSVKVYRCSTCNMVVTSDYAVEGDDLNEPPVIGGKTELLQ